MRKHDLSKLTYNTLHCISSMFSFYLMHAVSVLSNEFHHVCCLVTINSSNEESSSRTLDLYCSWISGRCCDSKAGQMLTRVWPGPGRGAADSSYGLTNVGGAASPSSATWRPVTRTVMTGPGALGATDHTPDISIPTMVTVLER